MLKSIIFILIAIALSVFAAMQFVSQLEAVSASKIREDDFGRVRPLKLGVEGRAVFAGFFFVVMIVLGLLSKFSLVTTILALILSVIMVLLNTYFKSIGIGALPTFLILLFGNTISSIKDAGFTSPLTGWGKVYVWLQIIALILLLIGTAAANIAAYCSNLKRENEDADELRESVEESNTEDAEVNEEENGDEEDVDNDDFEEDPFNDEFWNKAIKIGAFVILIVFALVLGYYLEARFDFFPPYNF